MWKAIKARKTCKKADLMALTSLRQVNEVSRLQSELVNC